MVATTTEISPNPRGRHVRVDFTVALTATDSDVAALGQTRLLGLIFPPPFDGTSVSFKVGVTEGTLYPLYDQNGTLVTVPVGAHTRAAALDPALLAAWPFVQIICASTQTTTATVIVGIAAEI